MGRVLRELLRSNREFAIGIALLGFVATMAAMSVFSPYPPNDSYVVPPDIPPSWVYPLGTTLAGSGRVLAAGPSQVIRNSLLFGVLVALLGRCLSLLIGLIAGYAGGMLDRVLMSINDTFIVIPLFPILVLFYFVMRDRMSWVLLALVMAGLGWAYDARLICSVALGLRTREFTETAIFSGMTAHGRSCCRSICPTCYRSCSAPR